MYEPIAQTDEDDGIRTYPLRSKSHRAVILLSLSNVILIIALTTYTFLYHKTTSKDIPPSNFGKPQPVNFLKSSIAPLLRGVKQEWMNCRQLISLLPGGQSIAGKMILKWMLCGMRFNRHMV